MRRSIPAPFVFTKFKAKASRQLPHLNKTGNESVVCGIRVKLMINHSLFFFEGGGLYVRQIPVITACKNLNELNKMRSNMLSQASCFLLIPLCAKRS